MTRYHFFVLFLSLWVGGGVGVSIRRTHQPKNTLRKLNSTLNVVLVLDMNSQMGATAEMSIEMALSEFYETNADYRTRLILHKTHPDNARSGASAAQEFLSRNIVHAIIEIRNSKDVLFLKLLGRKSHVPIISIRAASLGITLGGESLSYGCQTWGRQNVSARWVRQVDPSFVPLDDSTEIKAITAIVRGFQWPEIVFVYEDSECCRGFASQLTDAFRDSEIRISNKVPIYSFVEEFEILRKLAKVMNTQTRVLLVHMTPALGSRLFIVAKQAGMMSQGFAWLITSSMSKMLSSMDANTIDAMEGVLGIRPHLLRSNQVENFQRGCKNESDSSNITIHDIGSQVGCEILHTIINGISRNFCVVDGEFQPSVSEIFNVIGKGERIVGYWSPHFGLHGDLGAVDSLNYSNSVKYFKKIIWPGDSTLVPSSCDVPKFLRLGGLLKR